MKKRMKDPDKDLIFYAVLWDDDRETLVEFNKSLRPEGIVGILLREQEKSNSELFKREPCDYVKFEKLARRECFYMPTRKKLTKE